MAQNTQKARGTYPYIIAQAVCSENDPRKTVNDPIGFVLQKRIAHIKLKKGVPQTNLACREKRTKHFSHAAKRTPLNTPYGVILQKARLRVFRHGNKGHWRQNYMSRQENLGIWLWLPGRGTLRAKITNDM